MCMQSNDRIVCAQQETKGKKREESKARFEARS